MSIERSKEGVGLGGWSGERREDSNVGCVRVKFGKSGGSDWERGRVRGGSREGFDSYSLNG